MTDKLRMIPMDPVHCGCGGEAKVYQAYDGMYCVQCDDCGMTTLYTREPSEAITAWNRAMSRCTATVSDHTARITTVDGTVIIVNEHLCDHCKRLVNTGDEYCSHCGAKLDWSDDE